MPRLSIALIVLALAVPCSAAEDPKPNTLTPKEISGGWILLFDGETMFGWKVKGEARVDKGLLVLGGKKATTATLTTEFSQGDLQFQALSHEAKGARLTFNAYTGPFTHAAAANENGWHHFDAQVQPNSISVSSKGGGFGRSSSLATLPLKALAFHVPAGQKLLLRQIAFRPRSLKPIFNGKNLSGWKEFPGKKSQFTVTKEGWLSIKNGPGDLQSSGQWADFVLQLECFTNGDGLNSGVFFRCIPDKYQQGYEAQIQNGRAKKSKTYTIEEYDAQKHQLKDKKKIDNWSQDYGTGAIYRRIPARRAAAKDREWFTMTVVAHGRHIATWVNGIQVVNWDDNRPENENARNGCRLKKGPISLQGHDPTTDLLFHNIRISE